MQIAFSWEALGIGEQKIDLQSEEMNEEKLKERGKPERETFRSEMGRK